VCAVRCQKRKSTLQRHGKNDAVLSFRTSAYICGKQIGSYRERWLSSTPSSVLFSFAPRPVAGTRPRERSAQLHLPSGLLDKVRHKDREAALLPATHTSSPYRALHLKQNFRIFENWKKKKADQKRPFEKKCFFFSKKCSKTPLRTSCIGFSCLHIV